MTETSKEVLIESSDAAYKHYMERYEDSIKIVDPGIIPLGQNVLLTCALMSLDDAGQFLVRNNFNIDAFMDISQELDPVQTVIAKGINAKEVEVGDKVVVDINAFYRIKNPNSVKSEEVNDLGKNIEIINKRAYLLIHERDLRYIKERVKKD